MRETSHDHRDCYENAYKEQNLPLKDFSRAWIGIVVATIGENVSHTGQNSLLPMRLFIPNPSFRTSFRSLITCRAVQIHTFHSVAPMVVLTNSLIGTEHRRSAWEHQPRERRKSVDRTHNVCHTKAQFQQIQFWVTPHQFPLIPQLTIRFFKIYSLF